MALVSVYGKEEGGADTAVWLAGDKDKSGSESVAHQTIETLRELGILDDVIMTKEGLVVYPTELDWLEQEGRARKI